MQDGPKRIIVERLHLDAQQVAEYEKLIGQHQQEIADKQQEMGAAQKALFEELQSDDFPKKDSLLMVIGQLQQEMEEVHFQHFAGVKKLCKPDQLEAFNALTSELARFFSPEPKPEKGRHPSRPK